MDAVWEGIIMITKYIWNSIGHSSGADGFRDRQQGRKVLLTIYFVNVSLMLGFLREANTSKSVIDIYDELYHRLGGQDFRKLFPVILTDNGSEFSIQVYRERTGWKRISKDEDLLLQSKCAVPESRDRGGT